MSHRPPSRRIPPRTRPPRSPRAALAALAALALGACVLDARTASVPATRVVVVESPGAEGASAVEGALLAGEEGSRVAALVGRRFEVVRVSGATPEAAAEAAGRELARGALAVVGGFDDATCRALAAAAAAHDALWVNTGCAGVDLRDAERLPHAFHVAATDAMRRGARDTAGATLWRGDLARYGAAQLNERFERRAGRPMDGPAWAGWAAVKLLSEASLRAGAPAAGAVGEYLARADVAFDGHKGEPLRFGAGDHQLQQPLYAARGGASRGGGDEVADDAGAPVRLADPRAELLLVTNEGSASVSVIEAATRRVAGVIPLGHRPRGIQVSPDGARAYVALSDFAPSAAGDGDAIVVIDPRTGRELARHDAGTDPEQFALSPDGAVLYAANEDAGLATAIDLRTGRELGSHVVGIEPEGVAVSPDGRWVYVTAETSNTVSVLDTRAGRVVTSFLVDVRPRAAAFSPDARTAWVTNEISGTMSVVDARRHEVTGTVSFGAGAKPVGVVVSPDGRHVWVADGGRHRLLVVDAATRAVVAEVPVGRRPWGVTVSPDGAFVYTANGGSGDVSVVDAARRAVVATIPVGERPWGVAVVRGR